MLKARTALFYFKMAYSRGAHTLKISASLFTENRARLLNVLREKVKPGSVVVLEGGKLISRNSTDSLVQAFRQESYFFWAFGVQEDDFFGAIDVDSGKAILFPPRLPPVYAIICGKINPESWFKEKYQVDEVYFNDKGTIRKSLKHLSAKQLLLLKAENSDSGNFSKPAEFEGKDDFEIDVDTLAPIITDLRVYKTDAELEALRYAGKAASEAHKRSMKIAKPGMYEYQFESSFMHTCAFNFGCRYPSFTCIAASGPNTAVLHYGDSNAPNDKQVQNGDLCLMDMGTEYNLYTSDVTICFPCNGKFTEKQKLVYNAVLRANQEAIQAAKPGVRWTDVHILAERVILEDLKAGGILKGNVDEMIAARLGGVFMPHGLGHFMGIDVHDVGGYIEDATPRSTSPGLKSLRTTRTLRERMVITVEPGCYFIDTLLDAALENPEQAKFINAGRLQEFRGFGGVRIEDDVVIWKKGAELLDDVPRTVEEIEAFMSCP